VRPYIAGEESGPEVAGGDSGLLKGRERRGVKGFRLFLEVNKWVCDNKNSLLGGRNV